jgi:outer membrane protein TolC
MPAYFDAPVQEVFELQTATQFSAVQPIFAVQANRQSATNGLLAGALDRAQRYRQGSNLDAAQSEVTATFEHSSMPAASMPAASMPLGYRPWWSQESTKKIVAGRTQIPVSLDSLIQSALQNSPHIQVAATEPHIRQTSVFEEASQFDWLSYLETKYDDQNDPIGNTLTTGDNSTRFKQQEWYGRGGVKRKTGLGGEIDISQRLGYLDNNSRFLIPPDQGSSRLELSYRHPLFKGSGRSVNESLIVLANIDFRSASDDFLAELQSHLADVTETYWELVRSRSEYRQREKLLRSAEAVLENLNGRVKVDALHRQVYRAKAAVAKRRAEIARSITSIQNAESRLKLLVNDPMLKDGSRVEFVPVDGHDYRPVDIELSDVVSTALLHRPDISKAIRDVSAANVRLGVARNDVLPKLDLLVGSYVAGLDGDSDVFTAWSSQFKTGRPGFNVGFEFELPFGNRAAKARQERRQWEANRTLHQFRAVVETGITEVEIAAREVQTASQEVNGRYHAMVAAANETNFLIDRWQTLPGVDDSVTLLLEDLLDSQERQADEEAAFARAQCDFAVATVKLKQAMGTLFQVTPTQ